MLNYSIMRLNEECMEEFCTDIERQVKEGICTMPLFSMTLVPEGNPTIDKAEQYSRVYREYKKRLDARGVPSGALLQATIGHGWVLNERSAFVKIVLLENGHSPEICCPLDEGFRAYIRAATARIAAEHPAHIMLDDDFRLLQRGGCACELHMRKFNELAGTNMTREELFAALYSGDDKAARYKEIFIKTQIDSLISCAREIRAGIDSVDPSIPGSYSLCGNGAEAAYEIASIMAGEGNPVVTRLNNAGYCARDPRNFSHIMYRAAIQIASLTKRPDCILAETDTWPQNRYSTPAAKLHSHFTFSILEGAKGAKHWITRGTSYEPTSGEAYRKKLAKYKGFYHALADMTDGLTWLGCKIPVPSAPYYPLSSRETDVETDGWYGRVLDRLGLPIHFSPSGEGTAFVSGEFDGGFSDRDLTELLSGRIVMDAPAAERFIARGLGEQLGVAVKRREPSLPPVSAELLTETDISSRQYESRELIPFSDEVKHYSEAYHLRDGIHKDILFPAVTAYHNRLGGTAVVFSGDTQVSFTHSANFSFLNESRKRQLVRILSDLDSLPVYYPDDAEVLLKAARTQDGGLLVAFLDMSLDPIEQLPLVIKGSVSEIKRLTPDGKLEDVSYTKDGERYTLDITATVFDPIILSIK